MAAVGIVHREPGDRKLDIRVVKSCAREMGILRYNTRALGEANKTLRRS
jgi:hypothetical protein